MRRSTAPIVAHGTEPRCDAIAIIAAMINPLPEVMTYSTCLFGRWPPEVYVLADGSVLQLRARMHPSDGCGEPDRTGRVKRAMHAWLTTNSAISDSTTASRKYNSTMPRDVYYINENFDFNCAESKIRTLIQPGETEKHAARRVLDDRLLEIWLAGKAEERAALQ